MVRPIFVGMKLSFEEYEYLKDKAQKTSQPLSTYIRETSMGKTPHEKPQEEFVKALWKLDKIGNNLNQVTTRFNSYKYLDEKELKRIITELSLFIKELRSKYIGSG